MPFLDTIDPAVPAGTEVAGNGDDRIRELKRAIIERVESFFASIDADPWTVKPDAINLATAISDATIPGAKLIDGSVALSKLSVQPTPGAGSITAAQLADGSVTTPKLVDDAVTDIKLAVDAVKERNVSDGILKRVHLYDGLKTDLVRFQSYTLTLGAAVIAAGEVYRGSVAVDTNDQLGGAVACIIEPAYAFADASGATHPTDYILAQCSITLNGAQETLVYRLHNLLAAAVDLTGQVYFIHMFQRLSTAPAEV